MTSLENALVLHSFSHNIAVCWEVAVGGSKILTTMTNNMETRQRSSLISFLSRPQQKSRGISIDLSCATTSESTFGLEDSGELLSLRSVDDSQAGAYSRAAAVLGSQRGGTIPVKTSSISKDIVSNNICSSSMHLVKVDDLFNAELNRCDPDSLPTLRLKREVIDPIVIYESDTEEEVEEVEASSCDIAMQSRFDVLRMQEELLGPSHPEVTFLKQRIMAQCRPMVARNFEKIA